MHSSFAFHEARGLFGKLRISHVGFYLISLMNRVTEVVFKELLLLLEWDVM
jgi:hypothetical protein